MKPLTIAGLVLASLTTAAYAQSSVTMFGSLDAGVTYVTNVRGNSSVAMADGINKNNSLGFSGTEDLGGGMRAIFKLENGYSVDTGMAGQGGLLFGKQAYIGLSDATIGDLTLGRQYDFGITMLRFLPCLSCGIYSVENADLDRVSGERLNNTVQFMTRSFGGLSAGMQYSFASNTGNTTTNAGRAFSATVQYAREGFSAGAYYTDINSAPVYAGLTGAPAMFGRPIAASTTLLVDNQRILGAGAAYAFGSWRASALYTNTRLKLGNNTAQDQVLHVGGEYRPLPDLVLATKLSYDKLDASRWVTWSGGIDYLLSRSTDIYLDLQAQRAFGTGTVASIALAGTSSSNEQFLSRVGIKHLF
ncbi:porin [Paraburkholderia sediminicola]|uniref:porin n=1 Tax=Paraburkholderia sediminicola TaxID=458836 RepID=UPI0038B6B3E5